MALVRIYRSHILHEVHLAQAVLTWADLHPTVLGEHRAGLAGAIPVADAMAELWVPDEEADPARATLQEQLVRGQDGQLSLVSEHVGALSAPDASDNPQPAAPDDETCPHCDSAWEPGFDVCWNCDTPR